jgi:hypothetical protein
VHVSYTLILADRGQVGRSQRLAVSIELDYHAMLADLQHELVLGMRQPKKNRIQKKKVGGKKIHRHENMHHGARPLDKHDHKGRADGTTAFTYWE